MSSSNKFSEIPGGNGLGRHWRQSLWIIGMAALVLVGIIGLALAGDWQHDWLIALRIGWPQFGALLALSLINYTLRGLRWHIFARRLGLQTGVLQNFRHYFGGFAMPVTPGKVGELVRMLWLRRETGWSLESTAPLALLDRAADLAAMAVLLGIAVALSATGVTGAVPVTLLALAAAYVSTRPNLLAGIASAAYRIVGRWPRFFARIRAAARSLGRFTNRSLLAVSTLLGVMGWFAEGYAFYLLLNWMGADVSLSLAISIFVFSTIAGNMTGAPGGLGGAEAAMVALLSIEGVPLDVSLPATAVIRLTTLWFAIGGFSICRATFNKGPQCSGNRLNIAAGAARFGPAESWRAQSANRHLKLWLPRRPRLQSGSDALTVMPLLMTQGAP